MAKKTLRAQALETIQKLARIEAADDNGYAECWSCGRMYHYKDMDGGHFIPKGDSSYWALEKENIHPQCKGCNVFRMKYGTAAQEYTNKMNDFYGRDFVEKMLRDKKKIKKIYSAEYREMISEWNELIKEHEKRIGA